MSGRQSGAVDVPPDLVITMSDVRRAGYCARGARRWFEDQGFDFGAFLRDGIAASAVSDRDDAFAERVIARKLGQ